MLMKQTPITFTEPYRWMSAFTSPFTSGTYGIASPPMITSTFGLSRAGPPAHLHADVIHIDDLFCLCFIEQRDIHLFDMKPADGDREQFDKRRAGADTPVIDYLVTFGQPQ